MKVRITLPNGRKKTVEVSDGTTVADIVRDVPELSGREYNVRLKGSDVEGSEVLQKNVLNEVVVEEGDQIAFTPNVVGGMLLAA